MGIKSFLELAGSIGPQAHTFGRFTDVGTVKRCRLEEHCLHLVRDHGILTAHDPRNAYFLLGITDHQHIGVQIPLLPVKRAEHIPFPGPTHDDLMTGDGIQIVSVHGLSVLFHHVVGNIHQIVDGADSAGRQTALHPLR